MKFFKHLLLYTFMALSLLVFTFQQAEARMETFRGTGEYTVSDNETLQQAEDYAVAEALRNISEQVGVLVYSNTRVENSAVTYDEIVTVSRNYVKVLDKKISRSMTSAGDIHITADVVANADPEQVESELKKLTVVKPNGSSPAPTNPANTTYPPTTAQPVKSDIPSEYAGAVQQAEGYATANHLSKKGLFRHLLSNGYPRNVATLVSDHVATDWKTNALNKAQDYLTKGYYSKNGIYIQLLSPNEGFTKEEAFYAMTNINADWKAQALGKAQQYKDMGWTKDKINQRLLVEGFSKDDVQYAISMM